MIYGLQETECDVMHTETYCVHKNNNGEYWRGSFSVVLTAKMQI